MLDHPVPLRGGQGGTQLAGLNTCCGAISFASGPHPPETLRTRAYLVIRSPGERSLQSSLTSIDHDDFSPRLEGNRTGEKKEKEKLSLCTLQSLTYFTEIIIAPGCLFLGKHMQPLVSSIKKSKAWFYKQKFYRKSKGKKKD